MNKTVFVLVVLALAGLLLLVAMGSLDTGDAGGVNAPSASEVEVAQPSGEPAAPGGSPVAAESDDERLTLSAVPAPVSEEASEAGPRPLEGTIVVVDEVGGRFEEEDGKFTLLVWQGDDLSVQIVCVEAGHWRVEIPEEARLSLGSVTLGGRPARLDRPLEQERPSADFIELFATWPRDLVLHVVDEVSGVDLNGVELVRAGRSLHPRSSQKRLVEGSRSPIERSQLRLSQHFGVIPLLGRAPGFAWRAIAVDLTQGGERRLALIPGGEVEVELAGERPDAGSALRFFRAGGSGEPVLDWKLAADEEHLLVESLAAGSYRIVVQGGNARDGAPVQAETTVELAAGERAHARLVVETFSQLPVAPVAGVLSFGVGWETVESEGFALRVSMLDRSLPRRFRDIEIDRNEMEPLSDRQWRFRAPDLPEGTCAFTVEPTGYSIPREIGPNGDTALSIGVPAAAHVDLTLIDRDTDVPVDVDRAWWLAADDGEGRSGRHLTRSGGTGRYAFLAPAGPIVITATDDEYFSEPEETLLTQGANEVEISVRRLSGFVLHLVDGDAELPISVSRIPGVHAVEGDGRVVRWGGGYRGGLKIGVSEPGLYQVVLGERAGYETPEPIEVAVETGGFVEVRVDMVRVR